MKSRNNYNIIIILSLVLFLSIGYAVVNSIDLSISGTVSSADTNLNVVFTGDKTISNTSKGTATVTANSKTATFAASNMVLNETVYFIYDVANKETDIGARVTATTTNTNEYFSITLQEVSNIGTSINFDLAQNSTTQIKVLVKMIKTPVTTSDSTASFSVSLNATPIKAEDAVPSVATSIKFHISQVGSYTAIEGMTWEEYINSTYNTGGFSLLGDEIYLDDYPMTNITKDDVIESGKTYIWSACCFDPGTKILMADGTTKNIEDVEVGDLVMSLNEDTGEFITQRVGETIINKFSTDLVYVYLSNGTRLGMRAYHPLLTTEGWKSLRPNQAETIRELGEVELLEVGDTLIGYEENVTIVSVEQRPEVSNYYTYTLNIEGYHNYIADGIVAHNKGCK